ncbi:MAG: NrtA/SsuA/CpmA family ABC transporter substrate-binding protein [Candidatus Diapherotrites archaeon]|uniref:NrtA/SsuA/CpmA family ABC transporter substrate-binding protein n=1 Tax=Candidatus Iainarchaeum sp. TaxID=3101447 RepID=A0A8T4KU27_9ARCH|nr:NrtA/SsuA/CpmA family ABC transporter substrate-binding protein [Candidatus Diapherotrites archaeon]
MRKKLAVLCILVAIAAIVISAGFVTQANVQPKSDKVRIGLQLMMPQTTLIRIADAEGFFKSNALDVEITEFTAGKFAFQALLAKDLDFAVLGDIPPVLAKMQGNDFYILTEVGTNENEDPVLVIDDGSKTPEEYFSKPRKISTTQGGTPEFSFYLFMKEYGIEKDGVEIIAQKPEEMIGTLASGSVDGIAIFEPYPTLAEEKIDKKMLRFTLPEGVYPTKYLLSADREFVDKNPETAKRLLKALIQAEEFVNKNPEKARQIFSEKTKLDMKIIEKIWPDFIFKVDLSEDLLKNWEKEMKWAIETGKAQDGGETDFKALLRKDLLDAARK